jgi:hypothetical protein
MGLEFAEAMPYQLLIYEVTERHQDTPEEYHERESVLLRHANVVFAGSSGLYESCCHRNPYTYFIPDSAIQTWADITHQMQKVITERIAHIYSGDLEGVCR